MTFLWVGALFSHMNVIPAVILGALGLWLGMPNPLVQLPILAVLYPAALYRIGFGVADCGQALRFGWMCGLLGAAACLYWIAIPVHDFGGQDWLLAVCCPLVMGAYVGLYGGVFAAMVQKVRGLPLLRQSIILAIAWYLLEVFRGWFLTGFPWLTLASAFAPWPACIQGASLIGAYGLSGMYAGLACLIAGSFRSFPCTRQLLQLVAFVLSLAFIALFTVLDLRAGVVARFVVGVGLSHVLRRWEVPSAKCVFGVLLSCFVLFTYSFALVREEEQGKVQSLSVALIQGNLDQNIKWEPTMQRLTVQRYLRLSRDALTFPDTRFGRPVLLIWPETAMPFDYTTHPVFPAQIQGFARQEHVTMVFGSPGFRRNLSGSTDAFNRAILVGPDGMNYGMYEKTHLVPFGEYMPAWLDIPFLRPLLQGVGNFASGEHIAPLSIPVEEGAFAIPPVQGTLICYEAIFPELAYRQVAQGATYLVNISNDAWFGRSSAPEQHLQQSILRAVEQGRWLARATNTGISAIISPTGRISVQGRLFQPEVIAGTIAPIREPTLFFHIQPWLPWFALICLAILLPWRSLRLPRR